MWHGCLQQPAVDATLQQQCPDSCCAEPALPPLDGMTAGTFLTQQ
jgi:hypothetical protein